METLGALASGVGPPVGLLLAVWAQAAVPDFWGAVLQAGAIGMLLGVALYLIVVKGLLRPEREVTDRDAQLARLRADCATDLADQKVDYEKRLAEQRADHERVLTAERARFTEMVSSYEQRISKYEAITAKQEAMLYDVVGATRSLAQATTRPEIT